MRDLKIHPGGGVVGVGGGGVSLPRGRGGRGRIARERCENIFAVRRLIRSLHVYAMGWGRGVSEGEGLCEVDYTRLFCRMLISLGFLRGTRLALAAGRSRQTVARCDGEGTT